MMESKVKEEKGLDRRDGSINRERVTSVFCRMATKPIYVHSENALRVRLIPTCTFPT